MGYQEVPLPRKPQVEAKTNRTSLIITQQGIERLKQIAPQLLHTENVVLWWDDQKKRAAITVATLENPNAVPIMREGDELHIHARHMFEFAGLSAGTKLSSSEIQPSPNDGAELLFGQEVSTATKRPWTRWNVQEPDDATERPKHAGGRPRKDRSAELAIA